MLSGSSRRRCAKGDIVFMDNLRTHKIDRPSARRVEAVGAKVRYLPAYSPDPQSDRKMAFSKAEDGAAQGCRFAP